MGKIYFWCPDYSTAVGGVKILYRYVDILNKNGYEAYILHRHKGFRCDWFENTTQITYIGRTRLTASDYLVIPEIYGSLYIDPRKRPKASKIFQKVFDTPALKVVFNQNSYNTFYGSSFDMDEMKSMYKEQDIIATMVVSEDNKEYLAFAFPEMIIFRIHNSINQDLFSYRTEKKRQISFMPRKNQDHALQVINLLKYRGVLDGYSVVPIEGKTEKETAEILKESQFFLSFGYPEGCPLPPAEAMSCGCIVIGYHGMGGREYFRPEFCFPIEMGDITGFAKQVTSVLEIYQEQPDTLKQMGLNASAYIQKNYSAMQEQKDVIDCWKTIIGWSN